jgi:3-oxoacyl-[acyl-carrier protein] reductase
MKRLENKIAIITGGASGIGKATAEKFVQEGAKVIIWDLDEKRGNELAISLGAKFAKVNTSNYQEIEQAAKAVNDEFGRIDILINNAGITRDSTVKKMTVEQWGDLRVKAPNSRKHENNVDKRYIHPNKQSLGHLGEQKAYRGFFI